MIQLDNVTLFTYVNVEEGIDDHIKSLKHSMSGINFGSVKLLAPANTIVDNGIELIPVPYGDLEEFSRFSVEELHKYIDTDFCLSVQWDGAVINPHLWRDEFLDYDYIGAPWGTGSERGRWPNRIGNGGFSLRSQKFLQATAELKYDPDAKYHDHTDGPESERQVPLHDPTPEDWFVCVHNYKHMQDRDINFPDAREALNFSVEWPRPEKHFVKSDVTTYDSFGFHGDSNTGGMKEIYGVWPK